MIEADCPDHLCMKQKAVDSTGGTIVCLPNKVVIEGKKENPSMKIPLKSSPEFEYSVIMVCRTVTSQSTTKEDIMNQKKLPYLGLFAAVAIIFGYVESLIPFFAGFPGMKLGLANLAVLFIL